MELKIVNPEPKGNDVRGEFRATLVFAQKEGRWLLACEPHRGSAVVPEPQTAGPGGR